MRAGQSNNFQLKPGNEVSDYQSLLYLDHSGAIEDPAKKLLIAGSPAGLVNAAAEVVFDNNIKIKDRRLFVRDLDSRNLLKEAIDQLSDPSRPKPLALETVIIPRTDKLRSSCGFGPYRSATLLKFMFRADM
jgi:hypothetical protein